MNNYYDVSSLDEAAGWRDIAYSDKALIVVNGVLRDIESRYFQSGKKIRWADVGCGLGRSSVVAAQLGYDYTGIDSSKKNIECCRHLYPGTKFVCEDWLSHNGEYDLVSFISSLHHFEDWKAALKHALEMTTPGGVVLVDHEPNRLYSRLFRLYSIFLRRANPAVIGKVEIHWFGKPSILPEELPSGETQYHWDFFPIIGPLGIRTKYRFLGRFFESYRKVIQKSDL